MTFPRPLLFAAVLCLAPPAFGPPAAAQEPEREARTPPPAEVQAKIREWISVRQAISAERSAWEEEKARLGELDAVRGRETAQLEEHIAAAGARVEEIAARREAFRDEEAELRAWRRELESSVAAFEETLRPLLPRLPPPLRERVGDAVLRLETPDPEAPLQNRARDILAVAQACLAFDSEIAVSADLREIDGETREVEILWLGLAQAWWTDTAGRRGGYALPGPEGWVWSEDRSLAPRVRLAIDIHRREAPPAFVHLPLLNPSTDEE